MKKLVTITALLLFIFTLNACSQMNQFIDEEAPTISGTEDVVLSLGSTFNVLDGVTAYDETDLDITNEITYMITDSVGNPITLDLNVVGEYIITYRVEDDAGNVTTTIRTVTVSDSDEVNNRPVFSMSGDITILEGESFDPLEGITVSDFEDGNIIDIVTFEVTLDGAVISDYSNLLEGVYVITYTVVDSGGLADEITRTLTVVTAFGTEIEHVRLASVDDAKLRLEEFYDDIILGILSIEEVCTKYVGDVPFPINNTSYDDCVVSLADVSGTIVDAVVSVVMEADFEGEPIYIATVTVTKMGTEVTSSLEFAFLSLVGSSENHLHFYGDPLLHQEGGSEELAREYIEYLYNSIFDVSSDTTETCSTILVPMSGNTVTQDECTMELDYIKSVLNSYIIHTIYHQGQVTMPDETVGEKFNTDIELITTDGTFYFTIEFLYFEIDGLPNIMVVGDYLGELSFQNSLKTVSLTLADAENLMIAFYNDIYDDTRTAEDICYDYTEGLPFGPSMAECIEVINYLKLNTQNVTISNIQDVNITFDETTVYSGFGIDIQYQDMEMNSYTEYVEFLVIGTPESPRVLLTNHPLGIEDIQGDGFIQVQIEEADWGVSTIYQDLYVTMMSEADYCNFYMSMTLGSLPDYVNCERDIRYLRHFTSTYTILGVTELQVDYNGELVTGYQANIQVTNIYDEVFSFTVLFGFYQDEYGVNLVLLSYPGVYIGSEYDNAYLFASEAEVELFFMYTDLLDTTLAVEQVCAEYILVDPYGPTEQECLELVTYIRSEYDTFTIHSVVDTAIITEFEILNGYTAEVTLNGTAGTHTFLVDFLVVNYDVDFAVIFFGNPAGIDEVVLLDIAVEDAQIELDSLYQILLFTDISSDAFCLSYYEYLPISYDMAECIDYFDEIRANVYSVSIIGVSVIGIDDEGLQGTGYSATVIVTNFLGEDMEITVRFVMMDSEIGPQIYVLDYMGYPIQEVDYNFIILDVETAELKLIEMYDNIFNLDLATTDLCNAYVYGDPYGPIHEECMQAVDDIRNNFTGYLITPLEPTIIDWHGTQVDGFMVNMTLTGLDGDRVFDLYFAFADPHYLGHINLIFYGSPGGDTGPEYANMTLVDAINWINQYYINVTNLDLSNQLFCETYLALNNDMSIMDKVGCEIIRDPYRQGTTTFIVENVTEVLALDGEPPYFIATVRINDGSGDVFHDINFYFLIDQNQQVILTVQLEYSLGIMPVQ